MCTDASPRSSEVCNRFQKESSVATGQIMSKSYIEVTVVRLLLTGIANFIFFSSALGGAKVALFEKCSRQVHMYTYRCMYMGGYESMRMDTDRHWWISMDMDGYGWMCVGTGGYGWTGVDTNGY